MQLGGRANWCVRASFAGAIVILTIVGRQSEVDKLNSDIIALSRAGNYRDAIPLTERAIAIREKAGGSDDLKVAVSLNILGMLYLRQGRYSKAEPLLKRSLSIYEKELGHNTDIGLIGLTLSRLGELYSEEGRYSEAEPLLKRALSLSEESLGTDHLNVALSLGDLAVIYGDQGRYSEAEPLLERALAIPRKKPSAPTT